MEIPSNILQLVLNNKSYQDFYMHVQHLMVDSATSLVNVSALKVIGGDNCLIGTSYLFSHVRLAMYIDTAI